MTKEEFENLPVGETFSYKGKILQLIKLKKIIVLVMVAILGIIHVLNVFIYPGKELYHNVLHLVEKTGITLFLKRWKMIYKDIKDIKLTDLLEMQRQLDEEVAKPRDNGFVPRIRSRKDIILSMIAEIIEFNEETEHSHKTWKFKKKYEYSAIIEEATDILFFCLQLVNHTELEKFQIEAISQLWNKVWNYDDFYCDCDTEVDLIRTITRTDCYTYPWLMDVLMALILLYKGNAFLKNVIIQTYLNKWKKNMHRIKEDWSK